MVVLFRVYAFAQGRRTLEDSSQPLVSQKLLKCVFLTKRGMAPCLLPRLLIFIILSVQCLFAEEPGTVDPQKIYSERAMDGIDINRLLYPMSIRQAISHENEKQYIMYTIVGLICMAMLVGATCYWLRSCREPSYQFDFQNVYGYRMPSRTEAMDHKFFMA